MLLTIDHLVPLALGGLDEISNYVTCCSKCNNQKAASPLSVFSIKIKIQVEELPVHGDPIIDNTALPIEIRLLRKEIFDKIRRGELRASGASAQKKIEKAFRRDFWKTPEGARLEASFPTLPGPTRIMIPEIQTIAKSEDEFNLLVELAKSANTRNLISAVLKPDQDVMAMVQSIRDRTSDDALKRRITQALTQFARNRST